jgi:hypothetical protein
MNVVSEQCGLLEKKGGTAVRQEIGANQSANNYRCIFWGKGYPKKVKKNESIS